MQITKNNREHSQLSPRPVSSPPGGRSAGSAADRPALLGIWRLGEPIYAGRHSQLFQAQPADADGNPRFDYVLRTVPVERASRELSAFQLRQFVAAANVAKHPNLIAVLDACLESAQPFLIMPRLYGENLANWQRMTEPQTLPVVLWMVRQASQSLAALHAASWAHGDIQPENLFVSPQGHTTLIDLGFARPLGTSRGETFWGSRQYAAPELLGDAGVPVQAASDIFALGKVLLELLTWTANTVRNEQLLDPVAELVSEMISADPQDRPSAHDVSTRLLRLEIESLGEHIRPLAIEPRRAA